MRAFNSSTLKTNASATITNASNGAVSYTFTTSDTNTAGLFQGEFQVTFSGGAIETYDGEILIRSKGQAYTGEEFGIIPVLSLADGSTVFLRDIAEILDGFQDVEYDIKFNSEPALLIRVYRTGDQNALDIADAVHKYIKKDGFVILEIGIGQLKQVDNIFLNQGFRRILKEKDLQGIDRVVVYRYKSTKYIV